MSDFDIGGLLSDVVTGGINFLSGRYFQKQSESFQQYNADTQYQRGAADLAAAGINPILAYASPAATPSGATAQATMDNPYRSAVEIASAKQAIQNAKVQQAILGNEEAKVASEAVTAAYTAQATAATSAVTQKYAEEQKKAEIGAIRANAAAAAGQANINNANARSAAVSADAAEQFGADMQTLDKVLGTAEKAGPTAKAIYNVLKGYMKK